MRKAIQSFDFFPANKKPVDNYMPNASLTSYIRSTELLNTLTFNRQWFICCMKGNLCRNLRLLLKPYPCY